MSIRMFKSAAPASAAPVKFIAPVTSVAAYQEFGLSGKAGGDSTGIPLDGEGYQIVDFGGYGDPDTNETGLAKSTAGVAGFGLTGISAAGDTGIPEATRGYQGLGLTGKTAASASGLSASTQYYFKVNDDGNGATEYDITTDSDVTLGAVVALMDAAVTAVATVEISGGDVIITSKTEGDVSSIAVTAGSSGTDLLASLTGFTSVDTAVDGTGIYTVSIDVDGNGATDIPVLRNIGDGPITWSDYVDILNLSLGASATASIEDGDIVVTSATFGASSTVVIAAGATYSDILDFFGATPTTPVDGALADYKFKLSLDGAAAATVTISVDQDNTFDAILTLLNSAMSGGLTGVVWTNVDGNFVCTSPTTGGASAISITAPSSGTDLFPSITGFVEIQSNYNTYGLAKYYLTMYVDETTETEINITLTASDTFTSVIALLAAKMTGALAAVTWGLSSGDLRCSSAITAKSSIVLAPGTTGKDLIAAITGAALEDPVARVTSTEDPKDYSIVPASASTRAYPLNGASGASVFVWGDTNITGTATIYVGPSPTGPWAVAGSAISNPTTAGAGLALTAGELSAGFVKVTASNYTGGPMRCVLSASRPNGNPMW